MLDLRDCTPSGPAFPSHFFHSELPLLLGQQQLDASAEGWEAVQRGLRSLRDFDGMLRIANLILKPLSVALGHQRIARLDAVRTREGLEDGGWKLGAVRAWAAPVNAPAPGRFHPVRAAQRVLLSSGEQLGLLTDGNVFRILICDPARADSQVVIPLDPWRVATAPPDSFRLLISLACSKGLARLPELIEAGRLSQARVTTGLREQAREALEGFIQGVLDRNPLAKAEPAMLWQEALVVAYRLLFVLKLESATSPERSFSFAAAALWRGALSPSRALGPLVRRSIDHGCDTGRMLEDGLRLVFRLCRNGVECKELSIPALGGGLFDLQSTPLLDKLEWGERGVALLLDRLLWTRPKARERERVQYGPLDVEELGHVYETLLELKPFITRGRFELQTGTERKATGAYYTPNTLVRFLVRETLGPIVAEVSPESRPVPGAILQLKIVDPAAGSGHFLVEACRFLADALLSAARCCTAESLTAMPEAELLRTYLQEASEFGEARARTICRRLVAVHCLHGADRNRLAIELAKLSLWLETYADGLPLTFLDHVLVHGDSLQGPDFRQMTELPVGGGPVDPLLAGTVTARLEAAQVEALELVGVLRATVGRDVADLVRKQTAKARLDALLQPWRSLARSWAGATMLGGRADDDEWLALARSVAETATLPEQVNRRQAEMRQAGALALSWDLAFPDVFWAGHRGFDAVLGNPPWDIVQPNPRELPGGPAERCSYRESFARQHRMVARLYRHQRAGPGRLDLFRVFAERALQLAGSNSAIGIIVPSAFHANESAGPVRRLYLQQTQVEWCLSFENRHRMFDIHSSFKFALLVARRPGPTRLIRCGFYLQNMAQLTEAERLVLYDQAFIAATGGEQASLLELRSVADLHVAGKLFLANPNLLTWCRGRGIEIGREMNITDDAHRVVPIERASGRFFSMHEGKTIHQFCDRWGQGPRYAVAEETVKDKPAWMQAARHYRLALRKIARSTDERAAIAAIIPPRHLCNDTAPVERRPWARPNAEALVLCGILNSFTFDWCLRQRVAATVNLFILENCPVCELGEPAARMVAHAVLRLSARHRGYEALWRDQLGTRWREQSKLFGWPALGDQAEIMRLRASIDAVVAAAYGIEADDYERILQSFRHRSWPQAPSLCLAAFARLKEQGIEEFCWREDRYRDRRLRLASPSVL